ncbi:GGDEF domain-containing protein, partial [Halorubrum sp. Atlit-9R]
MLQQSEESLHQLAYYDMLTGLPNRLQFNKHFQDMIALYTGSNQTIAVMFADINRFKQINDTLGHSVGDILLQQAAKRFEAATLADCTVFRLGGDEFVFVGKFDDEASIRNTAQAICSSFEAPVNIDGTALFLTVSVGISIFPVDGEDMDTIVR